MDNRIWQMTRWSLLTPLTHFYVNIVYVCPLILPPAKCVIERVRLVSGTALRDTVAGRLSMRLLPNEHSGWTQWNEETTTRTTSMLYGSCNDSEWWLAFIMHNLYTKLRILGVVTDYHHVHTYIHITMGSKLTWNCINTQWCYSLMNMRQIHIFFKVWILWEGHKIWKNLPLKIWRYWVASNFKWKIFFKFCGLLRISEL